MLLSPEELRVVGALAEKALATPQQYPLTENSLVAACNQATNREPVTDYDASTVRRALKSLREQGLARMVHRQGERVPKHKHLIDEALSLAPVELAVLTVLLLRGPQTIGELRTRTERLHRFATAEEVEQVLLDLSQRPEPLVEQRSRVPGQKEARWAHLLADPDSTAAGAAAAPPDGAEAPAPAVTPLAKLAARVDELEAQLEQLRAELEEVRGQGPVAPYDQPSAPVSPPPPEVGSS